MPLGLLARDSIQDLENFGRGTKSSSSLSVSSSSSSTNGEGATKPRKNGFNNIDVNNPAAEEEEHHDSSKNNNIAPHSPTPEGHQTDVSENSSQNSNSNNNNNKTDLQQQQQQQDGDNEKKDADAAAAAAAASSYGQYSGFDYDYHAYGDLHADTYYYHDTYAPVAASQSGNGRGGGFWQGLLPCLFPWTTAQGRLENDDDDDPADPDHNNGDGRMKRMPSGEDDEVSNSSEIMGEKLSEKERMAVLNRLRLGQPDTVQQPPENSSSDGSAEKKKGLLNQLSSYESHKGGKIKGILKNSTPRPPPVPKPERTKGTDQASAAARRRTLFPQYSGASSSFYASHNKGNNVSFAPMARVVSVKSRNDMTPDEKADIWWQRADYDDFRKTGRIITRAMLEGGSEIWLSSQTDPPNQEVIDDTGDTISSAGDKWWHRFGHSRRGLEHVVSIDEGRQRQLNVKSAIRSCLEEQARQRLHRKQDPERLRAVALQYTSWARDLALASGASDADAVQSKFSDDRKSREFYLLKIARNSPLQTDRHVPDFMQPAIQAITSPRLAKKSMPSPHVLDENTAAQIRYRRQNLKKDDSKREEKKSEEICEPVHDAANESKKDRMAQRAAGFFSEGDEKVNMAAVLSGMGAVPQQKTQAITTAS